MLSIQLQQSVHGEAAVTSNSPVSRFERKFTVFKAPNSPSSGGIKPVHKAKPKALHSDFLNKLIPLKNRTKIQFSSYSTG